MKKVFLFLFLLVSISGISQTTENKKVTISLQFAPAMSYRHLGASEVTKTRNDYETSVMGFQAGIMVATPFEKKLGFESGLEFMHRGFRTKQGRIIAGAGTEQARIVYRFNYIGVPLKLVYRKVNYNYSFSVKAGMVAGFPSSRKLLVYYYASDGTHKEEGEFDAEFAGMVWTSDVGLAWGGRIGDHNAFEIGPQLLYDITSITRDDVATRLWDAGVRFVLYFK